MLPGAILFLVLEREERCYHCDTLIPAGTTCTKLTALDDDVYYLHPQCAEGNVERLSEAQRDDIQQRLLKALFGDKA